MPLFPSAFVDDLKSHVDIVQVVQERVQLRKMGATWKGLCPFHGEKTPSFHVNGEKGFFHCFGCGVGGDVIKFVELYDKVAFPEAIRTLAARAGLQVPEQEDARQDGESQREREALLKIHEVAAVWFREQLATPAGAAARRVINDRALSASLVEQLGIGYAPASGGLRARLAKEGFSEALLVKSGLVQQPESGQLRDRFRNRFMIPIMRDNGAIVAFGGRAMDAGQQPKYLNSPETAIYVKGRTLYGLNWSKSAISRAKYAVLVEGYFDWAQAFQGGITNVVASSGTALTTSQAKLLRRFAGKIVLSFDPDAAGQGAAARSSELLVTEGFQVNVAVLPPGDDPDNFIRKRGAAAYQDQLKSSRPYLDFLLDRTAAAGDLSSDEGRRAFLSGMLAVAARIPDAAARDQFADRIAHKARITEEVVRAEIRRAAVQKQTNIAEVERRAPAMGQIKVAERGLIWALMHAPEAAAAALAGVADHDFEGLPTRDILRQARALLDWPPAGLPAALIERLSIGEAALVGDIAREPRPPADPADCSLTLKRLRLERELGQVRSEIRRLQEADVAAHDGAITELLGRQTDLIRDLEAARAVPDRLKVLD
ncbi:MAG TPA: DNA primase [Vicinamibacterales bacterium]|jgi:DNA primase|nr:DNA primase [Vicinamibacterales bacterium]